MSREVEAKNQSLPNNCRGRGQRLERHTVVGVPAPPKKGRDGEFQPRFFGLSFLHAQRIRQVRRLQSYVRISGVSSPTANHVEHCVSLWNAIRRAAGFAPCFSSWWSQRTLVVGDPECVPEFPPSSSIALAFLNALQLEVRNLEHRLKAAHHKQLQKRRSSGLAHLYANVRRDAPVPVDVLIESQQVTIDQVDDDTCSVVLRKPAHFDPELPLSCNGHVVRPIMITEDQIFLDSVDSIHAGDLICQSKSTGRLDDVFHAFTEQWSRRWSKHAGIPHSHWDNIFAFARARLGKVEAPGPTYTIDLIRAIAKGKKTKAATGLDGVSRSDFLHLTSSELGAIAGIYHRACDTGDWPQQLTQGQVKSLAKREQPNGTSDYRPITIFAFAYRIWSSISSQHWLKHVSQALDHRLYGNRAGHRAAHLWRSVLEEVENSHTTGVHCAGVVFDLEKAFNTLPRLVCLGIASIMGVDSGTITAWSGALGAMGRRFVVRGSLSLEVGATCGFAEGCGMSCLAMMMLDQIWHEWILESSRLCKPMSFVDNWEVLVSDPALISVAAQATFELANQLDIVVDRAKSFAWATSSQFRQVLKQQGFCVKLDAADLGAHVTYSKQLRNSSLLARFSGLQDFWLKLKSSYGSHGQKAQVVLRAAWPRAMHAVSATWVGLKHYHQLRSAFMQAMRVDGPGANSFLQLHCEGFLMDPHAFAILQTFRDHRDLGASAWHSQVLADLVHRGLDLPSGVVSHVLLKRLHFLHWAVCPDGQVADDYGCFRLLDLNWSELCLRFQASWHRIVTCEIAHRAEFQGFEHVDVMSTRAAMSRLTPYQQGIFRRNLNGSTLTNEHAFRWSLDGCVSCPHCSSNDSLFHRYWECPFSQDLRQALDPVVLDLVPALPRACTVRSWFLRSPLLEPWWAYLLSLPGSVPPPAVTPQGSGPVDFFTDGSCINQESRTYRLASWAVCVATPFDESLNAGIGESQVVGAAALQGMVQTSFRAELMAICAALFYGQQLGRELRIWTDCQGVQFKYMALVQGGCQLKVNSPNADLWAMLLDLVSKIGEGKIKLIKVAAHQQIRASDSAQDIWAYRHNAAVDKAAKMANYDRPQSVWKLWEQLAQQTVGLHNVCQSILDFQLRVCHRWSDNVSTSRPTMPMVAPRRHEVPEMGCRMETVFAVPMAVSQRVLGVEHANRLLSWWNDFVSPADDRLQWVSFAQMYLHYQMVMKHPGAVRVGKAWRDPATAAILQPEQYSFRVRARWFRMQLQRLWKDCRYRINTATTRPRTDRITCFVGCASIPAKQELLMQVDVWLEHKARPVNGHSSLDTLPLAW